MLKISVNGESHKLLTLFTDIDLRHLHSAFSLVEHQEPKIKKHLLKGEEITQGELYPFMIDWLLIFSDLRREHLENIGIEEGPLDLGLVKMYEMTRHFLYLPADVFDIKEFEHKGKTYKMLESMRTTKGVELLLGNASYKQFKLMAQLSTSIDKAKSGKGVDALRQLLAVLYTDGKDTDEDISRRVMLFADLNAMTAYSGWFFFVRLTHKYRNFFQLFLSNPHKAKSIMGLEASKILISKTFIGRFLKTKWLNSDYLVLEE